MIYIFVLSLLSTLDKSHTQCNASIIYPEQTFVCIVDIQLIFKNARRNKKVYTKCKSEKYSGQIQHPIIGFKMELLVKIVNDFKLLAIFAKRSILDVSQVLNLPLTTINQTFFTNSKSYIMVFWNSYS